MILYFLVMTLSLRADFAEQVPTSFCRSEFSSCSEFSNQVVYRYLNGSKPHFNMEDSLYVGSCHMVGSSYDESVEQFGYLYLRRNFINIDFFGEFSFFANENPYLNLTLAEARKKHSEQSKYQVIEHIDHWQVRMSSNPVWQYFIRFYNSNLQLIGFWGVETAITCELQSIQSINN